MQQPDRRGVTGRSPSAERLGSTGLLAVESDTVRGVGNNATVAASATGTGEFSIREAVTHDISAAMEYARLRVEKAAANAIEQVADLGGDGGVIALDRRGNLATPFTTTGMFRGYVTKDGQVVVKLFGDE